MKMLYVELELYVVGYVTAIHDTSLAKGLGKPSDISPGKMVDVADQTKRFSSCVLDWKVLLA